MPREAILYVHAAKFNNIGLGDAEERVMCENSQGAASVALRVPTTEPLYLAVREECFLGDTTTRLKAVSDCFLARSPSSGKTFEMLKRTGVSKLKVKRLSV